MTFRRFLPFLLTLFLTAAPIHAQRSAASTGVPADSLILQGKRLLDAGYDRGDTGDIQRARALFLRASERRPAWARYYAGLAGYRLLPLLEEDEDRQEQALDDAIGHLEAAVERAPKRAEAHALLSGLYGWMAGQGMISGMRYGPKASRAMERAKELAPKNPRVVLIDAISTFNKPGAFGGDKAEALKGFERAARLFQEENVGGPLQPNWGHAEAYAWTGIAHLKADRKAQARQAFERALEINPDYGWVRDVLLPQLADAQ